MSLAEKPQTLRDRSALPLCWQSQQREAVKLPSLHRKWRPPVRTSAVSTLSGIQCLEPPPCAVADVEHFNPLLRLQHPVDHAINMWFLAVK
jgi:hypothetical protein